MPFFSFLLTDEWFEPGLPDLAVKEAENPEGIAHLFKVQPQIAHLFKVATIHSFIQDAQRALLICLR